MRRIGVALLLLCFVVPQAFADGKRRSTLPGRGNCTYGVLDKNLAISAIAMDATHVYYVDDFLSAVYRMPKNGGARTKLAELATSFADAVGITDMIVDDTNVYLATLPFSTGDILPPGDLYAIPKNGGTPRTIANGVVFVAQLAADATHVYWVSVGTVNVRSGQVLSDGKVERVRKDGSSRETLANGLSAPLSLVVDDASVYFAEAGVAVGNTSSGLRRVAKGGGLVVHVNDDYFIAYMTPAGDDLVFYGGNDETGGIMRMPKTGGAAQLLAFEEFVESAPRVTDRYVYYLTFPPSAETDSLMRVPLAGGTPELIRFADSAEGEFEVDECGVYIGTIDGKLVKGPR